MKTIIIAGRLTKDAARQGRVLTLEWLRSALDYDATTGRLTWKVRSQESFWGGDAYREGVARRWNREKAGREAGHIGANGYRILCIARRTNQAHRIAWAMATGAWPEKQIDHINHDRSDNRLENLREVSGSENCRNRSLPRDNRSGVIGVDRRHGEWRARIFHEGRRLDLGSFKSLEAAAEARSAASRQLGYHTNHGAA